MRRVVLAFAALSACGSNERPCTQATYYVDLDGDGYGDPLGKVETCNPPDGFVSNSDDCDDKSHDAYPGASELCNGRDDDCDSSVDEEAIDPVTAYADADGDGFGDPANLVTGCEPLSDVVSVAGDCDDGDASMHPDGVEVCNERDDDCDGLSDEPPVADGTNFYEDADGDGFGNPNVVRTECSLPPGYSALSNDCADMNASFHDELAYYRDTDGDGYGWGAAVLECIPGPDQVLVYGDCWPMNASMHPGATEICNSADDDCDGLSDEEDPTLVYDVWGRDADGDGYGDDTDVLLSCDGATGFVATLGDCADDDASINPASLEACDGIDQDCDGAVDDAVVYLDWYADSDGDGFGDPADTTNDCSQPSGYVLDATDCDDTVASTHPFAVEVCFDDVDQDCDVATDDCALDVDDGMLAVVGDDSYLELGQSLASADLDADGTSDMLIACNEGTEAYGTVFVVYGPASGTIASSDVSVVTSTEDDVGFGQVVSGGDANGDGLDDLLVGAQWDNSVYVFYGPITGALEIGAADGVWAGDNDPGVITVVADADGDGARDVVVSPAQDTICVVPGSTSGDADIATEATYTYPGPSAWSRMVDVAEMGDTNGDGVIELAVGVNDSTLGAAVYVVEGGLPEGTYDLDAVAASTITSTVGDFGAHLAGADLDDDGFADLLVGARDYPYFTASAVYAFAGPLSGTLDDTAAGVRWEGSNGFGYGLAVCDLDADKVLDVAIGEYVYHRDHNLIFVQLGPASGVVDAGTLLSIGDDDVGSPSGFSLACMGDWTGDDGSELLIGAYEEGDDGYAYVFQSDLLY